MKAMKKHLKHGFLNLYTNIVEIVELNLKQK